MVVRSEWPFIIIIIMVWLTHRTDFREPGLLDVGTDKLADKQQQLKEGENEPKSLIS